MIVDSSAIIAILKGEPDGDHLLAAIATDPSARMAAPNYLEAAIVVDGLRDPVKSRQFDDLVGALGIEIVAATVEHAHVARAAYRDFGKGSGHPAGLNFGDCFAYALARLAGEPLMFNGDDFGHTDIAPPCRRGPDTPGSRRGSSGLVQHLGSRGPCRVRQDRLVPERA